MSVRPIPPPSTPFIGDDGLISPPWYEYLRAVDLARRTLLASTLPSSSAVSLVSGTAKTITSLSLAAGDWDVRGVVAINAAATTNFTFASTSLSLVNNTTGPGPDAVTRYFWDAAVGIVPGLRTLSLPITPSRISMNGPGTVFLVARAIFTVSTATAYGYLAAQPIG